MAWAEDTTKEVAELLIDRGVTPHYFSSIMVRLIREEMEAIEHQHLDVDAFIEANTK